MATDRSITHLVVVGASAGGIEALSELVSTLPADFPAPLIVAQHLAPDRPSHLPEILENRTVLPVRTVPAYEPLPLEPGVISVVPAGRHVRITESEIQLDSDGAGRPKPSIDMLLSSAAQVFGERLIAVILTGNGSDGAAGVRAVKYAGGTVVSQDPETARFPSMPRSLAPTMVDVIVRLEDIGTVLNALLRGDDVPTQSGDRDIVEGFLANLREQVGIDFGRYKFPTIWRRLQRRVVATGTQDLVGYGRYLDAHPEEYQRLATAFLIKVTEFFRDPELFDYLRESILPGLINEARARQGELRIWSASCATGEEAYSLAILITDLLGPELDSLDVRIFATDADPEAIAYARRGVYSPESLAGMRPDLVNRYFTGTDSGYEPSKSVRSMIVFGDHDLSRRPPFPNTDLVLCRNVLIYFTPELQSHSLQLFAYSLRDGGVLVLGKAETVAPLPEFFEPLDSRQRVYRREGERLSLPAIYHGTTRLPRMPRYSLPASSPPPPRTAPEPVRGVGSSETTTANLPVGVIVVDRRYHIHSINQAARTMLAIRSAAIGEDLLHAARGVPYEELRAAIDSSARDGTSTLIAEMAVQQAATDLPTYLKITCHPHEKPRGPAEFLTVVTVDVTEVVNARCELESRLERLEREREQALQAAQAELARRTTQAEQLAAANRDLTETNRDLTELIAELRASNEELLLSAEEAQAANEEAETLNEELQATAEELETLNEEMQATVEELRATNEELYARREELEEMADTLESQYRESETSRRRVEVILASMQDAVVVVDRNARPLITNEAYRRIFPADSTEVVRWIHLGADGKPLPLDASPLRRAARGETFQLEFSVEDAQGGRRFYEASGGPIEGNGGVTVIRDITERSLRRLQEEFVALASHELRTPLTPLQSYLQLLLREYHDQPGESLPRNYAEGALAQVRRITRLVDDLVDVARLQTGKFSLELQPVLLEEVVREAVDAAQMFASGHTIRVDVDGQTVVQGDAQRLEQVILNLLTNAITYSSGTKSIELFLRQRDSNAELRVRDHGQGIPPEDLPHLFSRFYQANNGDAPSRRGLGLGLYISRQIVEAHGGSIEVKSALGQGTTFTVYLPTAQGVASD